MRLSPKDCFRTGESTFTAESSAAASAWPCISRWWGIELPRTALRVSASRGCARLALVFVVACSAVF